MDNELVVRDNDLPAIADDYLIQIADQAERRIDAVKGYCECGCGSPVGNYKTSRLDRGIAKGMPKRFALNHHTMGLGSIYWKGGTRKSAGHYEMILKPNHPFAIGRYVYLHRLIMEYFLKYCEPKHESLVSINGELYLSPRYAVHHKNGDICDNRLENLDGMLKGEHSRIHYMDIPKINGRMIAGGTQ